MHVLFVPVTGSGGIEVVCMRANPRSRPVVARAPMRVAEARITLGVVAARDGDLEHAVQLGGQALSGERKSLPSLVMVSRDLTKVLEERYPHEHASAEYLEELSVVSQMSELGRSANLKRQ